MVHCGERWVEMWKKHPEFCNKSRTYVQRIEYWIGLCDQIIAREFAPELVYEKFPEGAARPIKLEKDADIRNRALDYVCACLKRNETVTASDIKKFINPPGESEHCTSCSTVKSVPNGTKVSPDNDVKPPETPIVKTLKEKILSGKEVHIPIGPAQPPAMKQKAQPAVPSFSRASGNPPPPAVTEDQRSPKLNRYPLLSKSEWYGATSDFIDSCLSERYHRVISDIREAKPQRYPTPLDVICAGLEKMAESLQDGA